MQKRKQETVICNNCGIAFSKALSEIKRSEKLGRNHYCSLACNGKVHHTHLKEYLDVNKSYLIASNKADEYTGFRDFIRRAKNHKKEITVSLEYLKQVWDRQNHKCIYSGVDLILPKWKIKSNPIYTASLDRIDSSKGYIEGNVQFISIAMNNMKNDMSHEQTLELIQIIKNS